MLVYKSLMILSIYHTIPRLFYENVTAPSEMYTLSLHDALPIFTANRTAGGATTGASRIPASGARACRRCRRAIRSEEHTSELQSRLQIVCRLLLEKKDNTPRPALHYVYVGLSTYTNSFGLPNKR